MTRFAVLAVVLLWPTGFIVAKFALPDAGPWSFLAVRFLSAAVLMALLALCFRAVWPSRAADVGHSAMVGVLVHGMGLGGVWIALDLGIQAGVSALIMGLQPVLTALIAMVLLGERTDTLARLGLILGFIGVVLVVEARLTGGIGTVQGLAINVASLVAITVGTLYQKRFCPSVHLMPGNAIQLLAAGAAVGLGALLVTERPFMWTIPVWSVLAWSVLVLSIGAVLALWFLLRRGAATQVASLFYLMPPLTALMAWLVFDEAMTPLMLLGMIMTTAGVAMVVTPRRAD